MLSLVHSPQPCSFSSVQNHPAPPAASFPISQLLTRGLREFPYAMVAGRRLARLGIIIVAAAMEPVVKYFLLPRALLSNALSRSLTVYPALCSFMVFVDIRGRHRSMQALHQSHCLYRTSAKSFPLNYPSLSKFSQSW